MTTEISTSEAPVKSVFITGAQTSIGRETVRQLVAAGLKVVGAVTNSAEAALIRADGGLPAYPDLNRAGEVKNAITAADGTGGIVVNLAPMQFNTPPFAPVRWDEVSESLVTQAEALVEAAKMAGVEYLIHASFAFAGADAHHDHDMELVLSAVNRAEGVILGSGIPAVVLRFGYVYGKDDAALQTLLKNVMDSRATPINTDNHASAGWINAIDAARAIQAAMTARPVGQTLTVVDDNASSPAQFLKTFAERQGVTEPSNVPQFMGRIMLGKAQYALLNAASHVDNSDAKTALNWNPRFANYQQGIDDLLLSWRAEAALNA